MKDSGVEWLGEIPSHWEISQSKWLFSIRAERARPDDIQLSATQAYGVISQEEFMRRVGRQVTQITKHLEKRGHVEIDDFVISMRSFQGGLERAWERGCIRSSYVVLQPSSKIVVDYFTYLFKSFSYIQALRATSNYLRDGQDMNFHNFSLVALPIIPESEQKEIAAFLDKKIGNIDLLIEKSNQLIDLLEEFRAGLISEVVTGKIDVREWMEN
jgi:type I restriction enzyme S subunit